MSRATEVGWLSEAVGRATRSAKFCVSGCMPVVDPGLEVEGLGPVTVPLKRGMGKELVARGRVAPYGKGTQTLVNAEVRNAFELDPAEFRLSDEWSAAVAGVAQLVAEQFGLPAERIEPRLYKLLVYEKGGFFLPHRDSEKHDRMLASLVVVLPNPFDGGELIVRHGDDERKLPFAEAAKGDAPCYAAFYADCEHEVQKVTRGVRLALAYNLVLTPRPKKLRERAAPDDALTASIDTWIATQPARPLVFALEHHYTERGLALDLLKGADRQLANLVVAAAEKAGCFVRLAHVTRHLQQWADDGSFAASYSRWDRRREPPRREITIGETYEDDLNGAQWTDLEGKKEPWGELPLDVSAIVSSVPIDEWKPTSEELEGYTGNAGNTLDRWYHRSAIVVWRRDHHFEILATSGPEESIPQFCSMVKALARTPAKRREAARDDCIRFARAIIARWPRRPAGWHAASEKPPFPDFPKQLLSMEDRETVASFLGTAAVRDRTLPLDRFVVDACRRFGWSAFEPELRGLLAVPPQETQRYAPVHRREELALRDLEWLLAFCTDRTADAKAVDSDQSATARSLCGLAAERFCEPFPPSPAHYDRARYRHGPSHAEKALPLLIKALVASGCDNELSRVIRFVRETPDEFPLDACQAPCLIAVIPWTKGELGRVPPPLADWLAAVRRDLEEATAHGPKPPSDWARSAEIDCKCQFCAQLKSFLANPAQEVGRIRAAEADRQHLIGMANRHRCDVKHTLDPTGRPYSLVLTKTTASYERAAQRFDSDRRLLSALREAAAEGDRI